MLYTYLEHMYDYYVSETKPGTPSSSCSFVNTISLTVKKKPSQAAMLLFYTL